VLPRWRGRPASPGKVSRRVSVSSVMIVARGFARRFGGFIFFPLLKDSGIRPEVATESPYVSIPYGSREVASSGASWPSPGDFQGRTETGGLGSGRSRSCLLATVMARWNCPGSEGLGVIRALAVRRRNPEWGKVERDDADRMLVPRPRAFGLFTDGLAHYGLGDTVGRSAPMG
jgi:hypothetical protein